MDTRDMLANLRGAAGRILAQRLIVTSPCEKVADVPLVYAVLLFLAAPGCCLLAFLLGLIRHYGLRLERDIQGRV